MEPLSLASLVLSVATVAAIVWGTLKSAADRRAAESRYRSALYAAESSKEQLDEATGVNVAARADLESARVRAEEDAAEMKGVADELRKVTGDITDLTDALEKQNDIAESNAVEDTDPEGTDSLTPVSRVHWYEDGDYHYNQVTLWPTGGGVDIVTTINHAAQSVSLTWKELDLVTQMAGRLRHHDDEAPEPGELVDHDDLPLADEVADGVPADEAHARDLWAVVVDDAALFDAFNQTIAADEAAHDSPRPHDGWRDPDLDAE